MRNKVLLFVLFVTLCVGVYADREWEPVYVPRRIGKGIYNIYFRPHSMPIRMPYSAFESIIIRDGIAAGYPNTYVLDITDRPSTGLTLEQINTVWDVAKSYGSCFAWINYPAQNAAIYVVYTSANRWHVMWVSYDYK